jgi:hypothetical protein
MSIKILKLVNGDDVITTIGEGDGIVMEKPIRLMSYPDPQSGDMGIAFMKWCPYTDQEVFNIASINVITEIEEEDIPEDILNEYRKKFGSGLDIPKGPSLII